jgi:hypothetical protein
MRTSAEKGAIVQCGREPARTGEQNGSDPAAQAELPARATAWYQASTACTTSTVEAWGSTVDQGTESDVLRAGQRRQLPPGASLGEHRSRAGDVHELDRHPGAPGDEHEPRLQRQQRPAGRGAGALGKHHQGVAGGDLRGREADDIVAAVVRHVAGAAGGGPQDRIATDVRLEDAHRLGDAGEQAGDVGQARVIGHHDQTAPMPGQALETMEPHMKQPRERGPGDEERKIAVDQALEEALRPVALRQGAGEPADQRRDQAERPEPGEGHVVTDKNIHGARAHAATGLSGRKLNHSRGSARRSTSSSVNTVWKWSRAAARFAARPAAGSGWNGREACRRQRIPRRIAPRHRDTERDGPVEEHGEVVDGEREQAPRAEELEGLRAGRVFEAVALQRHRDTPFDRVLQIEEQRGGIIDPEKGDVTDKPLAEQPGVIGIPDAETQDRDLPAPVGQTVAEQVRGADVEGAEERRLGGPRQRLEGFGMFRGQRAGDIPAVADMHLEQKHLGEELEVAHDVHPTRGPAEGDSEERAGLPALFRQQHDRHAIAGAQRQTKEPAWPAAVRPAQESEPPPRARISGLIRAFAHAHSILQQVPADRHERGWRSRMARASVSRLGQGSVISSAGEQPIRPIAPVGSELTLAQKAKARGDAMPWSHNQVPFSSPPTQATRAAGSSKTASRDCSTRRWPPAIGQSRAIACWRGINTCCTPPGWIEV